MIMPQTHECGRHRYCWIFIQIDLCTLFYEKHRRMCTPQKNLVKHVCQQDSIDVSLFEMGPDPEHRRERCAWLNTLRIPEINLQNTYMEEMCAEKGGIQHQIKHNIAKL